VRRAGRPTETTPQQWTQAALDEIESAGVSDLAVESVARRLGVSKGGFYHHFADRRALLRAALALWEQQSVTDLAARFDAIGDPRARLHALLHHAAVEMEPTIVVKLMAADGDPDVARALARAAEGRLDLLRAIFRELGHTPATARHRALLAYTSYLGLAELRTQVPDALATAARTRAYLADVEATLLHDIPAYALGSSRG
jgi:AcrR family transcriptional regulator